MKIEKESDALLREYRQLVRLTEKLFRKYTVNGKDSDQLWVRVNQIFDRQGQIVKELEECTGVAIESDWSNKK